MKLEIRNLQSSATYEIDPEGAILGREGSKADIVLRDQAVSKKHAKIYEKNGRWYLEDLASSNGTFVDNRRITEPVVLSPGAVFSLSENQFEVVQVVSANGHAPDEYGRSSLDAETDASDGQFAGGIDDLPPLGIGAPDEGDQRKGQRAMGKNGFGGGNGSRQGQSAAFAADEGEEVAEGKGVGYFFTAIPKAIAYYMVAIPKMAVNPIGFIKKSVTEQKHPPMSWMQLAGYAIPAMTVNAFLPVIATIIVSIVAGAFAFGTYLTALIVAALTGIIGGLISGFIMHPLMKWLINILKGESDEKSRTNYAITTYTGIALLAFPSAIATLLTLGSAVPYLGGLIAAIGALLTAAVTAVMVFLAYTWFKHFNVVVWFQKVLMGLGALGVLLGVVNAARLGIAGFSSGPSAPMMASAGNVEDAQEQAQKMLVAAQAQAGEMAAAQKDAIEKATAQAMEGLTPEQQEQLKKAQEEGAKAMAAAQANAAKAMENAAKATEAANQAAAQAEKQAQQAAAQAEEVAQAAQETANKAAAVVEKQVVKTPVSQVAAATETATEQETVSMPTARSTPASGSSRGTTFKDFLKRREAVERAIGDDPGLLRRKDVLASYEAYLTKTNEIRTKWAKKKKNNFAADKINEKFKDLDVYENTVKMVDDLYSKLFE